MILISVVKIKLFYFTLMVYFFFMWVAFKLNKYWYLDLHVQASKRTSITDTWNVAIRRMKNLNIHYFTLSIHLLHRIEIFYLKLISNYGFMLSIKVQNVKIRTLVALVNESKTNYVIKLFFLEPSLNLKFSNISI